MTKNIDIIFKLILIEAATRDELGTELGILMVCLEVLERFRTLADQSPDEIAGIIRLHSLEGK